MEKIGAKKVYRGQCVIDRGEESLGEAEYISASIYRGKKVIPSGSTRDSYKEKVIYYRGQKVLLS